MTQESIQNRLFSSSTSGLESSYTSLAGRSARNTSTPFLMPDNNASGSKSGYGSNSYSLADNYDLGRHMMGDKSTAGASGTAKNNASQAQPAQNAQSTNSGPASQAQPLLSSSRAIGTSATASPIAEKTSPLPNNAANAGIASQGQRTNTSAQSIGTSRLAQMLPDSGMANAISKFEMPFSAENARAAHSRSGSDEYSAPAFLRAEISLCSNSGQDKGQNSHEKRKELIESIAMLETVRSNAQADAGRGSERLETPRMATVSNAVLEQMEKMRGENGKCANLSLDLPDGTTLEIELRWQGKHLTAKFGTGASRMRAEIENGWANLTRRAGVSGMRLEAPEFEQDGSSPAGDSQQYA
ncbi:MAG: hypothetical protein JW942_00960 [Opitutales bacterium]|nr:hypothetical protein [Opitutales bacterium]